jgi:hypothetical protein
MIEKIDAPVSVNLVYDHTQKRVFPKHVKWEGKTYEILKVGLHHSFYDGKILYHIFSAVSSTLFFKLKLNTENLSWRLEEIADA